MRRREFMAGLASAVAWPVSVRGQQAGRLPTIGLLGANATAWSSRTTAFVTRLRELGWIEGRTIVIEYRWEDGRPERAAEIAAEFVRLKVDVIVTVGSVVAALKRVTPVIPIVFALANEPGGNVTGLSSQAPDLAGKRLELLREVIPPAPPVGNSTRC